MLPYYRELVNKAFAEGEVEISCESYEQASSLRQKFYRFRRLIRASDDPLALLVDDLKFKVRGKTLTIHYASKDEMKILKERINGTQDRNRSA